MLTRASSSGCNLSPDPGQPASVVRLEKRSVVCKRRVFFFSPREPPQSVFISLLDDSFADIPIKPISTAHHPADQAPANNIHRFRALPDTAHFVDKQMLKKRKCCRKIIPLTVTKIQLTIWCHGCICILQIKRHIAFFVDSDGAVIDGGFKNGFSQFNFPKR